MAKLFETPTKYTLPLVKGQDLSVQFINRDPEIPTEELAFDVGATLTFTIDAATPVTATATIVGAVATVFVNNTALDSLAAGLMWRLVLTAGGVDQVVANGVTARYDGA